MVLWVGTHREYPDGERTCVPASLQRHKAEHLARHLVKAHEAREVARAESLLDDVLYAESRAERLLEVAEDILGEAREAKDLRTAIGAIRAAAARDG
jgi:hypothetical protein